MNATYSSDSEERLWKEREYDKQMWQNIYKFDELG